jgi:hypothetical protein
MKPDPPSAQGGGHHHRESDDEQDQSHPREPIGQGGGLDDDLHHLEGNPRPGEIDPEHLPQGSAVDLADDSLEFVHDALAGKGRHKLLQILKIGKSRGTVIVCPSPIVSPPRTPSGPTAA